MGDGFEYISKKLFLVTVCAELCSLSLVAALAAIGQKRPFTIDLRRENRVMSQANLHAQMIAHFGGI